MIIGSGNFGEITLVTYDGIEYACKTLKRNNQTNLSENDTLEICDDLLKEANIMEGKEHENILRLVGISQVRSLHISSYTRKTRTVRIMKSWSTLGIIKYRKMIEVSESNNECA